MSRYLMFVVAASALASPALAADREFDPDAAARAVAPYLDEQTFAVLHVDLTAVDVDALAKKAAAMVKKDVDALPVPRQEAAAALRQLTQLGVHDLFIVASLADLPENPPFVVLPAGEGADAGKIAAAINPAGGPPVHSYGTLWQPLGYEAVGDAVVGASPATLKRLHAVKPAPVPELAKAFAAADGGLAQLAVFPPRDFGKVVESVLPTLPAEVGGGSSRVLTHGFRWAAAGFDAPKLKLNVVIQAADADSARALLDLLKKTYAAVGKSKGVREALPNFDRLTELLTPEAVGDRLTLTLDEETLTRVILPLAPKVEETAEQTRSGNQLRQLAVASHNYLDANGQFPASALADKNAKPLLSWRVMLLPYVGEEKLYKEFHLDEPWDGEHNKALIARMPDVFRAPAADPKLAADGKTTYLAPVGDATMFPPGRGVRIAEVTDGTSTTILFVEAADDHAVVWTAPDDLAFDPKDPTHGLLGHYADGFLAAFADGSSHFIPKSESKDDLRALFTRNGGEVVNVP